MQSTIRALALIVLLSLGIPQTQARDNADENVFFETKVRPLLVARCFKCHSAESPKPKGGLRLDSRESISGVARDGLLLKLFFGGHADLDSLVDQVSERKRLAEERLGELEAIIREWVAVVFTDRTSECPCRSPEPVSRAS